MAHHVAGRLLASHVAACWPSRGPAPATRHGGRDRRDPVPSSGPKRHGADRSAVALSLPDTLRFADHDAQDRAPAPAHLARPPDLFAMPVAAGLQAQHLASSGEACSGGTPTRLAAAATSCLAISGSRQSIGHAPALPRAEFSTPITRTRSLERRPSSWTHRSGFPGSSGHRRSPSYARVHVRSWVLQAQ